jgi:hypothetical protein
LGWAAVGCIFVLQAVQIQIIQALKRIAKGNSAASLGTDSFSLRIGFWRKQRKNVGEG